MLAVIVSKVDDAIVSIEDKLLFINVNTTLHEVQILPYVNKYVHKCKAGCKVGWF